MTIDEQFEKLENTVREYNPGADFKRIRESYEFAKQHHGEQRRKSGELYITHPLAVAQIVAEELHLDSESIEAALLHDVIEDTDATYDDVAKLTSPTVADLVEGVSKLTRIQYATKEDEQMENLRKMLIAMSKDIRVILIKISDRLHNMRTMEYQTPAKQKQKSLETMEIYAPIAHRLGMQRMKWELEDLSLKYLDPIGYDEIVSKLLNSCWLFRLTVACLDFALDRFVQMIPWDQIDIVDIAVITHKVILTSEDDLIGIQGFAADIEGFRCGNTETTALADSVVDLTFVLAEDFTFFVNEVARFGSLSGVLLDEGRIVTVRNEADILAVRFVSIDEALLLRDLTDFFLGVGTEREECVGKLILSHGVEHIALILGRVESFPEDKTSCLRILLSACIVTACDIFTAKFSCLIEKGGEFQETVTVDTRVRCASVKISICELIDDAFVEFLLHGKYVIKHAETCGNTSSILCIGRSTACPVSRIAALWIIIKLQSGTGAVVALLNHQIGCNTGINTAAHGNDRFFIHKFFSC